MLKNVSHSLQIFIYRRFHQLTTSTNDKNGLHTYLLCKYLNKTTVSLK